jgi:hypothetical protein
MQWNDVNDDLAIPKPYRVIACMPVQGRLPLLKLTIERLYKRNGVYKVICSGDRSEDKELCESLGAVWVHHPNTPLGAKWNAAFQAAQAFNPDAVLYVGSSDWISDNWIKVMRPYIEKHKFAGTAGCYFMDFQEEVRCVFWPGYKATRFHLDRSNETIGIGRMLSAELMDCLKWAPFNSLSNNSLDYSMKMNCKKFGIDDFMVPDDIKALSISTNIWDNKHNFESHWGGKMPSEVITDIEGLPFPEIKQLHESLTMLRQRVG